MDYDFTKKNSQILECKKCNFKCSKKGDLERHLQTQKHKRQQWITQKAHHTNVGVERYTNIDKVLGNIVRSAIWQ